MNAISSSFSLQAPVRYQILPAQDGSAWIDVDHNRTIDDGDAYLTLESAAGSKPVDFAALKASLTAGPAQSEAQLAAALGGTSTDLVNGATCFDSVSSYRNQQAFEQNDQGLFLTLSPNPDAPYQATPDGGQLVQSTRNSNGTRIQLISDKDGVLHWDTQTPPPPPPDPQAVTQATCVERDGILHWVFPGERLEAGDRVVQTVG